MIYRIKQVLLVSLVGSLTHSAYATIVDSGNISVVASNENVNRPATNLLDYADLSVADETGVLANEFGGSNGFAFHSQDISGGQNYLNGQNPVNPVTLDFSFTTAETIDSIHLWNFGYDLNIRSVKDFSVELFDVSSNSLGTFNFTATIAPAQGTATIAAQTFSLGSAFTVSDARFTLINNFGNQRVGISKVGFGVSTIPEPSHFALGFAGIVALALCVRRRAQKQR